ncbi:hypothetical protein AVEN_201037-1 [Araneus ventricosus]|uniref:Uncharacterized protein n=1 Tax=Araneus ventricosus TaxID=182803 RepID=A0A4Y2R738_ARAVE|nr:hypothetical protein AVEN_201037-1 [Araneus ventricosus]
MKALQWCSNEGIDAPAPMLEGAASLFIPILKIKYEEGCCNVWLPLAMVERTLGDILPEEGKGKPGIPLEAIPSSTSNSRITKAHIGLLSNVFKSSTTRRTMTVPQPCSYWLEQNADDNLLALTVK